MDNNTEFPQEENKHQRQGRISKRKGNDAEKKYARIFRQAGWKEALTMRYVSKLKDDRKIDIAFVPVNVQVKAGNQKGMNIRKCLREIKESVALLPPHFPEHSHHAIVIHDKLPGAGFKRSEFDDIVSMTFKDYFTLLCMLHEKGKYPPVIALINDEGKDIPPSEWEGDETIKSE